MAECIGVSQRTRPVSLFKMYAQFWELSSRIRLSSMPQTVAVNGSPGIEGIQLHPDMAQDVHHSFDLLPAGQFLLLDRVLGLLAWVCVHSLTQS